MVTVSLIFFVCFCLGSSVSSEPIKGPFRIYKKVFRPTSMCYYQGHYIPCRSLYGFTNIKPLHGTTPQPYEPYGHRDETMKPFDPYYGKTTTTVDPVLQRSMEVRERYLAARNISGGNLFAFTEVDSGRFTSRIFDEIVRNDSGVCQRQLPPFTDCKIQELAFIFLNSPCARNNDTTPANSAQGTVTGQRGMTGQATGGATSGESTTKEKRRTRRNIQPGTVIRNPDGSVTSIISCEEKGSITKNNNLQLCRACFAITTLSGKRFPQYINEVICDPNANTCLSSTGTCVENTISLTFLEDVNNVGTNSLSEWREYAQIIRSSCTCQMLKTSPLRAFV